MPNFLALVLGLMLANPLAAQGVQVGQSAPAVNLPALQENLAAVSLASLRGKIVYLDFWASWCGPCRISLPRLNELRTELMDSGFEVLAINIDESRDDALKFLAEHPVDYPVVWDPEGNSPRSYGILGMPTGFLIDRQGIIRAIHQGFRKSDKEPLRERILELLEE